jgi:hypothetical protein
MAAFDLFRRPSLSLSPSWSWYKQQPAHPAFEKKRAPEGAHRNPNGFQALEH